MDEPAFYELMADILEVDAVSFDAGSSLDELEWDSLAALSLLAEIDNRFSTRLDAAAMNKCGTPRELFEVVASTVR